MRRPALIAVGALLLAGCATTTQTRPTETVRTPETAGTTAAPAAPAATAAPDGASPGEPVDGTASPGDPVDGTPPPDPGPLAAALTLAPAGTSYLTVTDWAAIKDRLGGADLTSESIQTDRIEFWRAVPGSTVLLTEGVLRAENSRLGLRHGVTQDDARWEVRWATGEGTQEETEHGGLALRLRDDLDLAGLTDAVEQQVAGLEGAEVMTDQHLLLRAPATGAPLASEPAMTALLTGEAETRLAAPGCLTWPDALGVDATVDQQEAVAGQVPSDALLEPEAWGMAFTGREARVTVVYPQGTSPTRAQADAQVRLGLAEVWPTTEAVGWADAFGLPPGLTGAGYTLEESEGWVRASADYRVVNPTAAATVALSGTVPWGVCAQIDWLAEPTGL